MNNPKRQTGNALIITLVIVAALAVLGGLGYVLWNNFLRPGTAITGISQSTTLITCETGEDEAATNGVFCSHDIGIKFTVPTIFKGKLIASTKYPVYRSAVDQAMPKDSAGTADAAFTATITGNDNFTFVIAKEPLRTGYISVGNLLRDTYFDQTTGILSNVNYDGTTSGVTDQGKFSIGDPVPSFTVDGVRMYKGTEGDAGVSIITYMAVIHDKIVKILVNHVGYMGIPADDPSTIDAAPVYQELDDAMHQLQTL
jgi:hypothetical protein